MIDKMVEEEIKKQSMSLIDILFYSGIVSAIIALITTYIYLFIKF